VGRKVENAILLVVKKFSLFSLFLKLGKCMFLSGLLPRPMCSDDDKKLLEFGIGFTNIVERTTRGSSSLTRQEIVGGNQLYQKY